MPTNSSIVINNGAATPVAHTFNVKANDQRISTYEDRVGGIAIGYGRLRIRTADNDSIRRVEATLAIPVLEAVSGVNSQGFTPAAKVAYVMTAKVEFLLPTRCVLQDRKDILAYAKNLLAHSFTTALVQDGDEITG